MPKKKNYTDTRYLRSIWYISLGSKETLDHFPQPTLHRASTSDWWSGQGTEILESDLGVRIVS